MKTILWQAILILLLGYVAVWIYNKYILSQTTVEAKIPASQLIAVKGHVLPA